MSTLPIGYRRALVVLIALFATNVGAYAGMFLGCWIDNVLTPIETNSLDGLRGEVLARYGGGLVGVAVFAVIGMMLIVRLHRLWATLPPDR